MSARSPRGRVVKLAAVALVLLAGAIVAFLATGERREALLRRYAIWRLMRLEGQEVHWTDCNGPRRWLAMLARVDPAYEFVAPPRYVFTLLGGDGIHRVVVVAQQSDVSFVCHSRVSVFTRDGHLLGDTLFSLGSRTWARRVTLDALNPTGPMLVVAGEAFVIANCGRQFYSLRGDVPVLVRLEDSDGRAFRNDYSFPDRTIGPWPPSRTAEGWERAILSEDRPETLAALVWLAGVHEDPDPLWRGCGDGLLAQSVRERPAVKAAIGRYRTSSDPWLREAAELAGPYEKSR